MSDGTKERKDTSSDKAGQSSGEPKGTSKGKLYTEDAIAKLKSDAAAEAGRLRKAAEQERDTLKQDLQTVTSRMDALERETNESRLTEVRGDPERLRAYQSEQNTSKRSRDLDQRERDIARREEQHKADREQLSKDMGVVSVAYAAAKHGLKVEDLEELGISDPDTLDKVADKIAAAKGATAKPSGEGEEEFNPDTGETIGSGEPTEKQRLAQRYPTMNIK